MFSSRLCIPKSPKRVFLSHERGCSRSLVFTVAAVYVGNNSSTFFASWIDTVHTKLAAHLEKIRCTQLIPIAGPVRKPKYVESPRVPGEAALPLRRGSEQGEPGQHGKSLFGGTWFGAAAVRVTPSDTKEPA